MAVREGHPKEPASLEGPQHRNTARPSRLRVGTDLLALLVPLSIALMMAHPDTLWGDTVERVVSDQT